MGDTKKQTKQKGLELKQELVNHTLGDFLTGIDLLPNPDPVLRKANKTQEVFQTILRDAHVVGEVQSMRAGLRRLEFKIESGDEDSDIANKALELVQLRMAKKPNQHTSWHELMWQMASAALWGQKVHEMVWYNEGGYNLLYIKDRPNSRFKFDTNGTLKFRQGISAWHECEPQYFISSVHMGSCENPYGVALLSSCFWPYMFKNGGWKFFVKFCERHGLPWPVGKYGQMTKEEEQRKFLQTLMSMVENGAVVIPDDGSVELLNVQTGGGKLSQQELIELCNKEISKALTSQAMTTEVGDTGARAASEVSREKEMQVNDAHRDLITDGMNHIFKMITLYNFGDDVPPPVFSFYSEETPTKERAEIYQMASSMGAPVSISGMMSELKIAKAEDDEDNIQIKQTAEFKQQPIKSLDFSTSTAEPHQVIAQRAADEVIEQDLIGDISLMLDQHIAEGKDLRDFMESVTLLAGELSTERLEQVVNQALELAMGEGLNDE